jgi:hypothetical protein
MYKVVDRVRATFTAKHTQLEAAEETVSLLTTANETQGQCRTYHARKQKKEDHVTINLHNAHRICVSIPLPTFVVFLFVFCESFCFFVFFVCSYFC